MTAEELRLNEADLVSAVAVPPSRPPIVWNRAVVVGVDTEYTVREGGLYPLSVQFAALDPAGGCCSRLELLGGQLMTPEVFCDKLTRFLDVAGVDVPPNRHGKRVVHVVAHFAEAELSMFADPLRDLTIKQIGKAHLAGFPPWVDPAGRTWVVKLIDTFAFFKVSLADIGKNIGLPKIDEDPALLADLLENDRERFERYAVRDAEIALRAFLRLREESLSRWGVDPLTHPTMASLAGAIFRHRFFRTPAAPYKMVKGACFRRTNKTVGGKWREGRRTVPTFAGNILVRLMAIACYWGGRVESFIRGFRKGEVQELDVKSLYPTAATVQPLPNEHTRWLGVKTLEQVERMEGFGCFAFRFPAEQKYPSLPVASSRSDKLAFPRRGESNCTFSEIRVARRLGADLRIVEAWGFEPGQKEREHELVPFFRQLMELKDGAERGSLEYGLYKLLMNSLIGKLAQHRGVSQVLNFERKARQRGSWTVTDALECSPASRRLWEDVPAVSNLWSPEWAALIVGRARAIMADLVARGALLVSTDAVLVPVGTDVSCPGLTELESVGSGLKEESAGDALFVARSRLYAVLRRQADGGWTVEKAARHGSGENEEQFTETLLACLHAGKDVAQFRPRTRLLTAEAAARTGLPINAEVTEERRTYFRWDGKRRLLDRDVNPFTSCCETEPYETVGKLNAADQERRRKESGVRPRRRITREKRAEIGLLLGEGLSVREVAAITGVPRSTVQECKSRMEKP